MVIECVMSGCGLSVVQCREGLPTHFVENVAENCPFQSPRTPFRPVKRILSLCLHLFVPALDCVDGAYEARNAFWCHQDC
jgi:hypothetical protein